MTSNKFSSRSFLRHRIFSHWYLALISAILFFLSGPFVLLMSYNHTKNNYFIDSTITLDQKLIDVTTRFFEKSDTVIMYVLAYAVATVIALVLYSYLNSKKQINFYHSQPISRKKLFASNYACVMLLGLVPLIIMFLLSAAIAIGTVGFGSYLSTVPMHILGIVSFYCAGLSITVLACQLTGSTIFAMYTVGFLNFFLPATALLISTLLGELSSTLYVGTGFITYLSPVTYFITKIIGFSNVFTVMQVLSYSFLALTLAFLSYGLYLIRPSEVTGNTIVYRPMGAFIKYVSAFVFSVGFAFITNDTGGGFGIFITVFGGFIFISCLFMEVAFRRSFRNIKTVLPSCIIATIVAVGGIYALSAFAQNLDTKVPDKAQVKVMTFNFVNNYMNSYISGSDEEIGKFDDPELISKSIDIINKIIADSNYRASTRSLSRVTLSPSEENINTTNITVRYNNSYISRTYYGVNVDLIMQELSSIYENPVYKDTILSPLKNALSENRIIAYFGIDTKLIDNKILGYSYNLPRYKNDYVQDDKYLKPLVNALILDIEDSQYADLTKESSRNGNMTINVEDFGTRENNSGFNSELYDSFDNVKSIVSTMSFDPAYAQFIRIDTDSFYYEKGYAQAEEITIPEPASETMEVSPETNDTEATDTNNAVLSPITQ